ncbi:TetR/AcrR family transcriptional regulator [Oceanobacillus bengalensis]|uniref:TetR family transcriptional regulator n=1 Tax=Oceanobacillus bengalensis TaxID=1435466 RepID=A0A494YZ58_9BACI|nr:TetR/AcrR family transcriptional regulator [Oceanobacillus bengalensis]RKQ15516.1 TetR family transcriptional regulator [Oceanobacillus bengalensis]
MQDYVDKRIQRSKSALKKSFLSILAQKNFDKITISEIASKANYNRGTFYANFDSKEKLLDEIIRDVLDEMVDQIRNPYKSIERVNMKEMRIEDIMLFTYFKENAELYKLLLSDHIRVDFRYQIAKAIEALFLMEYEYELEEGTILNPKWLYVYRAHGIAGVIIRWMEEDFQADPAYMSEQIVELMLTSTEVFNVKV